mgnify:CR=1 FL=1
MVARVYEFYLRVLKVSLMSERSTQSAESTQRAESISHE